MSVYFIQCGDDGPIKIGFTRGDPEARMADLQTAHHEELRLLLTLSGEQAREGSLHDRFCTHRIRGEWFRPDREILGFVDGVKLATTIDAARQQQPQNQEILHALDIVSEIGRMLTVRPLVMLGALKRRRGEYETVEYARFLDEQHRHASVIVDGVLRTIDCCLSGLDGDQIDALEVELLRIIDERRERMRLVSLRDAMAMSDATAHPSTCGIDAGDNECCTNECNVGDGVRDAVNAWVAQGEVIFRALEEEGRDYMLNEWAKRVKKLEGYAA